MDCQYYNKKIATPELILEKYQKINNIIFGEVILTVMGVFIVN